jgi:ABC-2 type transport system ATP-binding protein
MPNENIVIETRGLSRVYRKRVKAEGLSGSVKGLFKKNEVRVRAVIDFELRVERGEILGLIGPNGAGKTTIIKMLTGIIRPTEGEASVLGFRPRDRKEAFLSRIALVAGQKSQLWWDLPARDSFRLSQAIYRIPEMKYRETLSRLSEEFGVTGLLESPVRSLSLGERMKMEFIGALLHEPDLLFLDEPTIGLDAPSQKRIREFLSGENRKRGVTVILTSHYMEDIRRLCPRTVVVSRGEKTYDGDTEAMFARAREHRLIRLSLASEAAWDPGLLPGAELIESSPGHLLIRVRPEALRPALPVLLGAYEVSDLSIEEEEMADSVERIYREGADRA